MLNDALKYVRQGFALVPLRPNTKLPNREKWTNDPIKTEDQARKHWLANPKDNIGIVLGAHSGICGIDFDGNHGATGEDFARFPRTVTARTRNGYHFFYKLPDQPGKSRAVICHDPEKLKAHNQAAAYLYTSGRQFVLAPSVVSFDNEGNPLEPWEYRFHEDAGGQLSFAECPLADLPEWIAGPSVIVTEQKDQKNDNAKQKNDLTHNYPPNTRHAMLLKTATAMRKRGCKAEVIEQELHKRNLKDCNPPKPEAQQEIALIVKWALENVTPTPIAQVEEATEFIIPLGHLGTDYYYTSSSNRQIVCVSRASHNAQGLLDLMPAEFWRKRYLGPKGGIDWVSAGSDLMEACRDMGIFDEKKMRGLGCWRDDGRLVINLGDKLLVDGAPTELNGIDSRHIYALGPSIQQPSSEPLNVDQAHALVKVMESLSWNEPSSAILLAGGLAMFRICGALPWRPMIWLTGAAGTGKSTIMERVINKIAGSHGVYILGNTTEAGIRQELHCDARPVVFDEAETNNKRSASRVQNILELIRQASSDSDGRILKGTSDGKGHNFKINSSFILASIRVNLQEEADISRFCVLELKRSDPAKWPAVRRLLDPITDEYGDKLFARTIKLYDMIMASRQVFEDLIATIADRRTGQQYGVLLAGYWSLVSDSVVGEVEARELVRKLSIAKVEGSEGDGRDESECVDHLLHSKLRVTILGNTEDMSITKLLCMAKNDTSYRYQIQGYGLDCDGEFIYIARNNPYIAKIYKDSKWQEIYSYAWARLPGAEPRWKRRFEMRSIRCVKIPFKSIFHE